MNLTTTSDKRVGKVIFRKRPTYTILFTGTSTLIWGRGDSQKTHAYGTSLVQT